MFVGVSAKAWVGDSPAAGQFYIYNPTHNVFLRVGSTVTNNPSEATLFKLSGGDNNVDISFYNDNTLTYVYESAGNQSWGNTHNNQWKIESNNGGYYISHTDPGNTRYTRYINYNGSSIDYPREKFNNDNRTWIFISQAQMADYCAQQAETNFVKSSDGWQKITQMPENVSDYYFAFVVANAPGYMIRTQNTPGGKNDKDKNGVFLVNGAETNITTNTHFVWMLEDQDKANNWFYMMNAEHGNEYLYTPNHYMLYGGADKGESAKFHFVYDRNLHSWYINQYEKPNWESDDNIHIGPWDATNTMSNGLEFSSNKLTDVCAHFVIYAMPKNSNNYSLYMSNERSAWEGATGTYSEYAYPERYAGDNTNFNGDPTMAAGRVMYQEIVGLPNGYYEVQFYAVENHARGNDVKYGNNIARVYAKCGDTQVYKDVEVYDQGACDVKNYPHTLICQVVDGKLEYGLRNIDSGGNWAVVATKSLTYLGDASATMKCVSGKLGTFCAPFDVTLPGDIKAYTAEVIDNSYVKLTPTAENGNLAAGTPVIISSDGGLAETSLYGIKTVNDAKINATSENTLVGMLTDNTVPAGAYVLQTQNEVQAFYQVKNNGTASLNRCYLDAQTTGAATRLSLTFDEATLIEAIKKAEDTNVSEYYSVSGTKMQTPVKGINIVKMADGSVRKIMVK